MLGRPLNRLDLAFPVEQQQPVNPGFVILVGQMLAEARENDLLGRLAEVILAPGLTDQPLRFCLIARRQVCARERRLALSCRRFAFAKKGFHGLGVELAFQQRFLGIEQKTLLAWPIRIVEAELRDLVWICAISPAPIVVPLSDLTRGRVLDPAQR